MPIQSMSIALLARRAKEDIRAIEQLREIAEEPGISECPRKDAWQALAGLHKVVWLGSYSSEMIMNPASKISEGVREEIRHAMRSSRAIITPPGDDHKMS